jgi:hypothetical protein
MFMHYLGGGIGHLKQRIPQLDVLNAGAANEPEPVPVDMESYNALAQVEDDQVSGMTDEPIAEAEGREEVDDDSDKDSDSDDDAFDHSDDAEDSELDSNLGPEDGENGYYTSDDDNL